MSEIQVSDLRGAAVYLATNGNAVARVMAVKNRNQIRVATSWHSAGDFSSTLTMAREQATALRDALTAALEEA